ncbi:MAG: NADH-quinone oxidoreductase subunit J [Acidimicrobiia bacterium]
MDFSDWITTPENWTFAGIGLVMLFTGLRTVTSPNVVHAALYLVATLAGSAGVFLLLGAEFVAWAVVLIYIGAVVVLFLFGVMITRAPLGRDPQLDHGRRWPAALVALSVFAVLAATIVTVFEDEEISGGVVRTRDIGESIFERFVIPFEVVSLLLLAALIGGIVLARRDDDPAEDGP